MVTQEARLGATDDLAVRDGAARDLTDPRDGEDLPDLRTAEHLLVECRLEKAFERVAHVVHRLVDHRVEPDVDTLALGEPRRLGLRAHVEADDDRVRGGREQHVGLGDPADRAMEDGEPHVVRRQPAERLAERLDGALHVRLEHHLQLPHLAGLDLLVELVERDLGRLGHLGFALLRPAVLGHLARLLIVLHRDEDVARLRHAA